MKMGSHGNSPTEPKKAKSEIALQTQCTTHISSCIITTVSQLKDLKLFSKIIFKV